MMTLARNSRCRACLAAIGCFVIATPCTSAAPKDQDTYRCNAPNGRYDGSAFPISDRATLVSGRISLHAADIRPEWASVGKILVHQHGAHYGDGDCGCNGIAVYAFKNPDHIEFYMKANGEDVPIARSPYDRPITFKMSISPQGVMTVAIGRDNPVTKTVTLRHPEHDMVEMTCSGADVSFIDIAAL
jgi:hypothetical protein